VLIFTLYSCNRNLHCFILLLLITPCSGQKCCSPIWMSNPSEFLLVNLRNPPRFPFLAEIFFLLNALWPVCEDVKIVIKSINSSKHFVFKSIKFTTSVYSCSSIFTFRFYRVLRVNKPLVFCHLNCLWASQTSLQISKRVVLCYGTIQGSRENRLFTVVYVVFLLFVSFCVFVLYSRICGVFVIGMCAVEPVC
jgi:hypothetical protein